MFILFIILLIAVQIDSQLYTLVKHPLSTGAACLDGSPAGLYYHQGKGANKDKFLMYFRPGGFCGGMTLSETLQQCYKRSFSSLGTTKDYPPQKSFDNQGLLSTDPEKNPVFYDWTKIYVIYCDGSMYQGSRKNPINYKDTNLYFRGTNNTLQQFKFMQEKFDFYNKDTIVITGQSAGGIATYLWVNYLVANTKTSKVYGIPDSGYFITDYQSPILKQKILRVYTENLFKLANQVTVPVPQCMNQFNDTIQCLNAANIIKEIKAPLFIIQSTYEAYAAQVIVYVDCLENKNHPFSIQNCNATEKKAIDDYRSANLIDFVKMKGNRNDIGFWAPACVQHGFSDESSFKDPNYKVPTNTGKMLYEAIEQFLEDPYNAKSYIDKVQWPNNTGCNGLSTKKIRSQQ